MNYLSKMKLKLIHCKILTEASIIILAMLVALSQARKQSALLALNSSQSRKGLNFNTKTLPLSETKMTSTVRPWPSHNFFKNVLSQPNEKLVKVGQPQNIRTHDRPANTRQRAKLGQNKTDNTKNVTKNEEILKGKRQTKDVIRLNKLNNPSVNQTRPTLSSKRTQSASVQSSKATTSNSLSRLPQNSKVIKSNAKTTNKIDKKMSQANGTSRRPSLTVKSPITKRAGISKPVKENNDTEIQKKRNIASDLKASKSKLRPLKSQTIKMEGSKKTRNIFVKGKQSLESLTNSVVVPFRVIQAKFKNPQFHENNSKGVISLKTFNVYKAGNRAKISNTKHKIGKKKFPENSTEVKNELNDLFEWIENDNEFSVSPSTNLPNFTNLKWPYTENSHGTVLKAPKPERTTQRYEGTPLVPEYNGIGFQFALTIPSANPTTEAISTLKELDPVTRSWKRVPTVTPYSVKQLKSKQNLVTYRWGSVGSTPSPIKPQTTSHPVISPEKTILNSAKLVSNVEYHVPGIETVPGKPLTNIWYKPIINHFASSSHTYDTGATTSTSDSSDFPLLFKLWSFKNGSLKLENQKEIPAWAINGFEIKDGSVLNLDQIPEKLQTLVSSAVVKNKKNNEDDRNQPQNKLKNHKDVEVSYQDLTLKEETTHTADTFSTPTDQTSMNVNYIILKDHSSTHIPSFSDSNRHEIAETQTVKLQKPTVPSVETSTTGPLNPLATSSLDQYLHFLTTPKPYNLDKAETVKDSWNRLQKWISHNLVKAAEIEQSSPSPLEDSAPSKKTDDRELLSNLAAVALLIAYLKSHKPQPSTSAPHQFLEVPLNPTSPSYDFNTAMLHLFQQLVKKNHPSESSQRVKVDVSSTLTPQASESEYSIIATSKPPEKLTKTLLVKGIFKKGKKKKKLKRRRFKKKKKGLLFNKLLHPIVHLFKKPKHYWFDLKFDVDIHDILKKKFLYLLAFKYAPLFFVLALAFVPLGLVIIPLLYKIYWVKKRPKYIRVPVPVPYPKPYPVHPHYYQPHHPGDLHYAADTTGLQQKSYIRKTNSGMDIYPLNFPGVEPVEDGITDPEMTSANLEDYQKNESPSLKPHPVNHAYDLGFDLGSKLGSVTNIHDKEVLQILIENKKNKINKLLEKWKLLHKGKYTSPIYSLEAFEKEYTTSSKKRRKRKSKNVHSSI